MAKSHNKLHAIVIAIPFQGHINPVLNLSLKLASKGFTITFVHLEFIHHKLSKAAQSTNATSEVDFFSKARELGLDIRYTTICDGFPVEFDRDIHFEQYWKYMLNNFEARVDEFVGQIIVESDNLSVLNILVTDTCYAWLPAVAKKHNLVSVSLWTEPALVFSLIYHKDLLRVKGQFPCEDNVEDEINYIPGIKSINTRDFMPYLTKAESGTIVQRVLCIAFEKVKNEDFILHNTVQDLEYDTLLALDMYQPNYAVGPINFFENLAANSVSKSLWSESDCANWLSAKPPGSVLYVSFGSLIQTNKQVIEEIAYGLLLSEANFIWVVRAGVTGFEEHDILPAGFEHEVKDKGLIVPWCNQIAVLSDPATGGFLTHCGWNSTVESIWCGVPMICYPVTYDQPTNRKLVVEDWRIGIDLCNGKSIDRKGVAATIKSLMSGTSSKSLRQEASKVKEIFQNAVGTNGSSEKNFDRFINDLNKKMDATIGSE